MQRISETLCKTLHVDRAATWLLNPATDCFVLLNRYDQKTRRHSNDAEIPIGGYPNYFSALEENLIISAVDAHSDYRTREFSENYLVPNGIGSLLNVPLRITGRLGGILCVEHVGGQRLWNEHEKRFVLSVAELISQRLLYEDIQINDTRYRELGTLQQAIFNGAYCSIISTKLDGTIQSFNRAASRMLGYSAEELTGQQALTLFHDMREMEQRAHELSNKLGRAIEPGFEVLVTMARRDMTEEREWTYVRKDGERIPVVASITALVDQNETVTGFLVISRDITDRILTQRALREEEARYRLLFESTNDAIFPDEKRSFRRLQSRRSNHVRLYQRANCQPHASSIFPGATTRRPDIRGQGTGKNQCCFPGRNTIFRVASPAPRQHHLRCGSRIERG